MPGSDFTACTHARSPSRRCHTSARLTPAAPPVAEVSMRKPATGYTASFKHRCADGVATAVERKSHVSAQASGTSRFYRVRRSHPDPTRITGRSRGTAPAVPCNVARSPSPSPSLCSPHALRTIHAVVVSIAHRDLQRASPLGLMNGCATPSRGASERVISSRGNCACMRCPIPVWSEIPAAQHISIDKYDTPTSASSH